MLKRNKIWFVGVGAFLLGVLLILSVRFINYDANYTHYHANFGVYINGQREEFTATDYYEEVTACKQHTEMTPEDRAHMHKEGHHDDDNAVSHVHDNAVTWGQFFENLGWMVGKDFVHTRDKLYQNDGQNILHIMLNGQDLTGIGSVTNRVIGNEDVLLLSYGDANNDELNKQNTSIPTTAGHHNQETDPASCSGPSRTTVTDRLKHLF